MFSYRGSRRENPTDHERLADWMSVDPALNELVHGADAVYPSHPHNPHYWLSHFCSAALAMLRCVQRAQCAYSKLTQSAPRYTCKTLACVDLTDLFLAVRTRSCLVVDR